MDEAPRTNVPYTCERGHAFTVPFADGATPPLAWMHRCGAVATLDGAPEDEDLDRAVAELRDSLPAGRGTNPGTEPMAQLRKRRSDKDGAAILAARLAEVKAMEVSR
jgi:hypothetical protein